MSVLKEVCNLAFNTYRCFGYYGCCSEFNKDLTFRSTIIKKMPMSSYLAVVVAMDLAFMSKLVVVKLQSSRNITGCVYKAKYPNCTSNDDDSTTIFSCYLTEDNECEEICNCRRQSFWVEFPLHSTYISELLHSVYYS